MQELSFLFIIGTFIIFCLTLLLSGLMTCNISILVLRRAYLSTYNIAAYNNPY